MLDFECKETYNLNDFLSIVRILRGENGCPWDREQTHESIKRNLLEEAYEVCEAIDENDPEHLKEELGDLLMQVIFHSQIEMEAGSFDIECVADAACKKLIRRHPHIFGNVKVENSEEVLKNWDDIKRRERSQETVSSVMSGVARSLPALWRAEKIQFKAKKAGFDWHDADGAMDKLREELLELEEAVERKRGVEEEIGDLLFTVVNVARFMHIDPEYALNASCEKFIRRFALMEKEAEKRGQKLDMMTLDEMEKLYIFGKTKESVQD